IIMELAEQSLHDLLLEYRRNGQPGIPRREALGYLREAAEVLDLMNLEYFLQHLDIKPSNLFLVGRHIKVADFGLLKDLGELYAGGRTGRLGAITPLYASPESFRGQPTIFSDQYSLAVTYCELVSGNLPFQGKNFRQLAMLHTTANPDLTGLQEAERH